MLALILMVFAFVLFVLAAVGVPAGRINLIAAGLACATLAYLLPHFS
jgi:hypothetical protein